MPEISPSKYLVIAGGHWHRKDRQKVCRMCQESLPLCEFYAYGYVTRQGKRSTRYESRCKACARHRRKKQYYENPDCQRAKHREWLDSNADKVQAYRKARQADPEHRAKKAAHQRRRKARKRAATENPDCPKIKAIYLEARRLQDLTGIDFHVDHIIPLARGGKHVASNLQILTAVENMRKGVRIIRPAVTEVEDA